MRKAITVLSVLLILSVLITSCGGGTSSPSVPTGGGTSEGTQAGPPAVKESAQLAVTESSAQPAEATQTAKEENTEGKAGINLIKARVTKAVDGDTVYVKLENGREEKVRFIGVDTPESTTQVEPYGKEAASFTKSKLLGKNVWLELDVQERDKYGRLLAYVWLSPPTKESDEEIRAKMFNAVLLLEGYAQVMTVPPNVKYAEYFKKYQQEAREKNAGLWGVEVKEEKSASSQVALVSYIGNKNSKKFHLPDCQRAEKISPANRVYFKSRDEAIKAGYVPCKVCRP